MTFNFLVKGVSSIAIIATGICSGSIAQAQSDTQADNSNTGLDQIIVTARRTSESINDAPLSIGVLSKDFIADQKIESVEEVLQLTPGATFLVFNQS